MLRSNTFFVCASAPAGRIELSPLPSGGVTLHTTQRGEVRSVRLTRASTIAMAHELLRIAGEETPRYGSGVVSSAGRILSGAEVARREMPMLPAQDIPGPFRGFVNIVDRVIHLPLHETMAATRAEAERLAALPGEPAVFTARILGRTKAEKVTSTRITSDLPGPRMPKPEAF